MAATWVGGCINQIRDFLGSLGYDGQQLALSTLPGEPLRDGQGHLHHDIGRPDFLEQHGG